MSHEAVQECSMNLASSRKADQVMIIPYSVIASEYYTHTHFKNVWNTVGKTAPYANYFYTISTTY